MALRLLIRQGFCRTIQKTTRLCCWASHESWFYCQTMFLRRIGQILREDVTLLASFTDPQVRPYFLSAEERGSTGSPILDYQVLPAIKKIICGFSSFHLDDYACRTSSLHHVRWTSLKFLNPKASKRETVHHAKFLEYVAVGLARQKRVEQTRSYHFFAAPRAATLRIRVHIYRRQTESADHHGETTATFLFILIKSER